MHIKIIPVLGKIVWTRYEKYRVELAFYNEPMKVFWVSKKQGDKLKEQAKIMNINFRKEARGFVIGVFDGARFVWCGHIEKEQDDPRHEPVNDLFYLKRHFKVKDEDVNLSISSSPPNLAPPSIVEVDKELLDEA